MLEEVLMNYDFKHPEAELIRHNENMTYLVKDDNQRYLLRIHKAVDGLKLSQGCGNVERQTLISSEIELLNQLHTVGNLKTQYPIKNKSTNILRICKTGIRQPCFPGWTERICKKTAVTDDLAYKIGQTIGKLHNAMSKIFCPDRYCYGEAYVDMVSDDIRKAYELKHIAERNYRQMQDALSCIRRVLVEERRQFIFVHADLSKSNLINSHGEICPIDFSLWGMHSQKWICQI